MQGCPCPSSCQCTGSSNLSREPACDAVQVNSLHLLNFTLKAKHLVQLATVTRLCHLSLDNVTLEARNTIQKLTTLQACTHSTVLPLAASLSICFLGKLAFHTTQRRCVQTDVQRGRMARHADLAVLGTYVSWQEA